MVYYPSHKLFLVYVCVCGGGGESGWAACGGEEVGVEYTPVAIASY